MQVKELKQDGLSYELEVTVGQDEIDQKVEDRLKEYGKTLKIPGFRPGKVPLPVLKLRYGKSIMGEVLEKAVNDSTQRVIEDKGLRPALQPKIEVTQFDEGKDLTYKMALEVVPDFEIIDLKSIEIERPVTEPDTATIEDTLKRVHDQNRETEEISEDRATEKGDIVLIDFQGRMKDGTEHQGMSAEDHQLELGAEQFIPGFEDQLVDRKIGEKVDVEVTFPEQYHADALAGEDAVFEVAIKKILEPKDFKNYDELAEKVGLGDEETLRQRVTEQLQGEYNQLSRFRLKRHLLDILDEEHDMPVPQGMVDMEFDNIKQQISMEQPEKVKDGKLDLPGEEEDELKAISVRRVKLGMILSEIGRQNNIQVADQELQRAVIEEAQKYPGQEAQVFEYYQNNPQALEALRAPVFEDKVVDYVLELANVTDKKVSPEELSEEDEESYLDKKDKKDGAKKKDGGKKSAAKKDDSEKAGAKKSGTGKSTSKKSTSRKSSSQSAGTKSSGNKKSPAKNKSKAGGSS